MEMFDNLENTYKVRLKGCMLTDFYKKSIDMLLLKYISIIDKAIFKRKLDINNYIYLTENLHSVIKKKS